MGQFPQTHLMFAPGPPHLPPSPFRTGAAASRSTVYEPCYDDLAVAAEANDPPAADEFQVFPDYDGADPAPVYD
jgi:hypothetical protein